MAAAPSAPSYLPVGSPIAHAEQGFTFTATELAAFVNLRHCGRYLRLSTWAKSVGNFKGIGHAVSAGPQIDEALAAAGHRLEAAVATELRRVAPHAPGTPRCDVSVVSYTETRWQAFLGLLSTAVPKTATSPVGCWADEVVLRGRPTANSVVNVSGRADFIVLLWRRGMPVLRIVECKASSEAHTKHLVQLVLYRMVLLTLLRQEAAKRGGHINIGGSCWAVPGADGATAAGAGGMLGSPQGASLQVECLLRNLAPGAAADVVAAEPLPAEEVAGMTRALSALLEPGGRIATCLDPRTLLQQLPFELDSHCAQCPRATDCWADAAARGAVQLSGCSADQARRFAAAGVTDIEDLAGLRNGGSGGGSCDGGDRSSKCSGGRNSSNSSSSSTSRGVRRLSLDSIAAATAIPSAELQRLSLAAAVRAQRRLGPPLAASQQPRPPQFALLPGAPPSCLPDTGTSREQPLAGVFLSVATDSVLRRVVGLAARVAVLGAEAHRDGGAARVGGGSAAASQSESQPGWDVVGLMRGVRLDGQGGVVNVAELDDLEFQLLDGFSERLCDAVGHAAESAASAAAVIPAEPAQMRGAGRNQPPPPPSLHFYVHSHAELRSLLSRCMELGGGSRGAAERTAARGRPGSAAVAASGGDNDGFAWLPHLLGMRAALAGEQSMCSVLEEELGRYVTVWQGAGRLAATSVDWAGDGSTFKWLQPTPEGAGNELSGGCAAGSSGRGPGGSHPPAQVDLRALFAGGGFMDCLERYDPQRHKALAAPGERQPMPPAASPQDQQRVQQYGHSRSATLVQVRPDTPGSSIPPSFFRAVWTRQQEEDQEARSSRQRQRWRSGRSQCSPSAQQLEALLLAQAHAVRWLEARLAQLPSGCNPDIAKRPLPVPLGPALRSFRLSTGTLDGGPRLPPSGPQVPIATGLARAAVDAVRLNRAAEVAQFWRELGSQPPAARAAAGASSRTCMLVLDSTEWVSPPSKRSGWLRGRVRYPEGCASWQALCELTGLSGGAGVLVSAVDDPWVGQDAKQVVAQRCALGVLRPDSSSRADVGGSGGDATQDAGEGCGQAGGGGEGLWVECHPDYIRYPFDGEGRFVLGTPGVQLHHLAAAAGQTRAPASAGVSGAAPGHRRLEDTGVLVLDAAPNVGAWVASSVVEALQEYGTSSAYLAGRLCMPEDTEGADVAGEVQVGGLGARREEGAITAAAGQGEPATPRSAPGATAAAACGSSGGGDAGAATPSDVMQAHGVLSPASPLASPTSPPARSNPAGGSRSAASPDTPCAGGAASARLAASSSGNAALRPEDELLLQRTAGSASLHADQLACVRAFLSHPELGSRVLLQGPPGTGKTETLAMALLAWLAARIRPACGEGPMGRSTKSKAAEAGGGVVLISGPTHTAVDTVLDRVALKLLEGEDGPLGRAGVGLAQRVKLVRLGRPGESTTPLQKKAGGQASVPTSMKQGVWYLVGGTLRHLVKAARELRTQAARLATPAGRELMESSGRGAFASALLLDEASMVFAPQLLALGGFLVTHGSLLVAGDHRQLPTILQHDFAAELRPNLLRYRPHVSAFEYMRALAAAELRSWLEEQTPGGRPPPIANCALTYTFRLPAAVTYLISPLYRRDGIRLQGRPAPPSRAALVQPSAAAAVASLATRCVLTAHVTAASMATVAVATSATYVTSAVSTEAADAAAVRVAARTSRTQDVWTQLWSAGEGVFLVLHNEEGSVRTNPLELQLVRIILDARPHSGGSGSGSEAQRPVGLMLQQGTTGSAEEAGGGGGGGGVSIITPHRAQRRALQAVAEERRWGCRVETVERMQGGEADTVIFCATVSDPAALERSPDFYTAVARANVAFSRTKKRLIVIASRAFLSYLPASYAHYEGLALWRQLRLMCEEQGRLLGEAHVRVGAGAGRERRGLAVDTEGRGGEVTGGTAGVGQPGPTYRCDVFEGAVV